MSLIGALGGAFFTSVLGDVKEVVLAVVNKKIKVEEIDAKIKDILVSRSAEVATTEITTQGNVIQTEVKSDSWLTRNWRPLLMCWFAAILSYFVIIEPWLVNRFGLPPLQTSDVIIKGFLDLVKLGMSGYVVGRSLEKVADKVATGLKRK